MANTTWKKHERRTAAALGGRRTGPTGKDGPDVDAGWIVAECKHRAQLPGWIDQALGRVRAQAGPARLGVVVAHERGARDSWVILSLHDFRDWFGSDPGAIRAASGDDPGGQADAGAGGPMASDSGQHDAGGGDLRGDPAPAPATAKLPRSQPVKLQRGETVKLQRRPGVQLARPQPVKLTRRAGDPLGGDPAGGVDLPFDDLP
jgi:hypothetical protein